MVSEPTLSVPIRYGILMRRFMGLLGLGPRFSGIDVDSHTVRVRLGWGFRTRIPRESITAVTLPKARVISRGAHGFLGRWLVNGAGTGLVTISIEPRTRAWVMGVPIRLRELTVSVDDPAGLAALLQSG